MSTWLSPLIPITSKPSIWGQRLSRRKSYHVEETVKSYLVCLLWSLSLLSKAKSTNGDVSWVCKRVVSCFPHFPIFSKCRPRLPFQQLVVSSSVPSGETLFFSLFSFRPVSMTWEEGENRGSLSVNNVRTGWLTGSLEGGERRRRRRWRWRPLSAVLVCFGRTTWCESCSHHQVGP